MKLLQVLLQPQNSPTFAGVLSQFPELVQLLEDPELEWTIWAPCELAMQAESEVLLSMPLDYRQVFVRSLISPMSLPSAILRQFPNLPLAYMPPTLNGWQLLRTRPTYVPSIGPTFSVNFNAYILGQDIAAENGTIHIIDRVPELPPTMQNVLESLPRHTFSLLRKVILLSGMNFHPAPGSPSGGTFFAPTDAAFAKNGLSELCDVPPKTLAAWLDKQFCPNQSLYSNQFWRVAREQEDKTKELEDLRERAACRKVPFIKAQRTFELRTAFPETNISVAIDRYGPYIDMRCNSRATVISADHLASNGVVHLVDDFLFPLEDGPSTTVKK